jgi:hypothetical protein
MSVGSSSKLVQSGGGRKTSSLQRVAKPANEPSQDDAAYPKIKLQSQRSSSKREIWMADKKDTQDIQHSRPVYRGQKKNTGHTRQISAININRHNEPNVSLRHQRKKEWTEEFDALEGLAQGKIEVKLVSEEKFSTFLTWVHDRKLHTIKLNNSLAGFERDFQTLHSLGLTDEFRVESSANYVNELKDEYAASPGICDLLRRLPELQSLDISRCDPSEPDLMKLLNGLTDHRYRLNALQADRIYWGDRPVVQSLLNFLSGPTSLEKLSIKNAMGYKFTPHSILKALRTNTGLKEVSLSVSGKKGAIDPEDIALTIFLNPTLKKLSVSANKFISCAENIFSDKEPNDFQVNDLVIYHFMSAFVKNTSLEMLSISGAALPAAIIDAITDSIGDNSAIRTIYLEENDENWVALQRLQSLLEQREKAVSNVDKG